jgi:hypothetical protein
MGRDDLENLGTYNIKTDHKEARVRLEFNWLRSRPSGGPF